MSRAKKRRIMSDINVVPYIDVMLVLLIIFMVTAPLLTQGVEVDLPSADAQPIDEALLKDRDPIILTVSASGDFYLSVGANEDQPIADSEVVERARKVINAKPDIPVLVRADHRVPYGDVVAGMVLLQQAGAKKVGFVTDPPERLNKQGSR